MKLSHWGIGASLFLGIVLPAPRSLGQESAKANAELREARERLGSLKAGMTSDEVFKLLGKPDEVRRFDKDLLDGVRYFGDPHSGIKAEAERWAYGVTAKGMFARVGIVCIDRNGKVIGAIPADSFAKAANKPPVQVPANRDDAVVTPAKLSCHLGAIKYVPSDGDTTENLETRVTLKNAGTKRFELKHDAAYSPRRFLLVEIYDSTGLMLFRIDEMLYHSTGSLDPAKWPVLEIEPGKEISTELYTSHAVGFGRLPAGRYSLRIYFPFEKGKDYPSNPVSFEMKEEDRPNERK
jgi:hypothetical protein